ncbi:unnamed protein product [Thlaspi arvense]|uniref:Uncharacterized protein n=1 Tax=Thlaspi arvense TaxID=13288 RepID=A0AAU9RQ50_THLAR|nr:unnamed protein product [Thlaspi arvense]
MGFYGCNEVLMYGEELEYDDRAQFWKAAISYYTPERGDNSADLMSIKFLGNCETKPRKSVSYPLVFWNLEDCPFLPCAKPDMIYHRFHKAFAQRGFTGASTLSTWHANKPEGPEWPGFLIDEAFSFEFDDAKPTFSETKRREADAAEDTPCPKKPKQTPEGLGDLATLCS